MNKKQILTVWYGSLLAVGALASYSLSSDGSSAIVSLVAAIFVLTSSLVVLFYDYTGVQTKRLYWYAFAPPLILIVAATAFGVWISQGDNGLNTDSAVSNTTESATSSSPTTQRDYFVLDTATTRDEAVPSVGLDSVVIYEAFDREDCVWVSGVLTNESAQALTGLTLSVAVYDTLGTELVEPASLSVVHEEDETRDNPIAAMVGDLITEFPVLAPGESGRFQDYLPMPCMDGSNREYEITLTDVRLGGN